MTMIDAPPSTNGRIPRSPAGRSTALRRPRRRLTERLSVSVVAGIAAALLAFVVSAALLRDRREMTTVAVAKDRIPAGVTITPEMVTSNDLPANTGFAGELVDLDSVTAGGLVAARTIQPGEPITKSAVGSVGSTSGKRVMSIPVKSAQAAGGEIQVGDQIDVIETTKEGPRYVLLAAAVVGRSSDGTTGGLVGSTRSGDLVLTVEVTADEALTLAAAVDSGKITIVRSTGAAPVEVPLAPPPTQVTG